MDRLRRLFTRKDRKVDVECPPSVPPTQKRGRTLSQIFAVTEPKPERSQWKRAGEIGSERDEKRRRIDSVVGSDQASVNREPPKLDWKPATSDLSGVFENLSVKDATSPPKPRFKTSASVKRKDSVRRKVSLAKRRQTMPPQTAVNRSVKRRSFTSQFLNPNPKAEPNSMSLDELLNQPLFGDSQTVTSYRATMDLDESQIHPLFRTHRVPTKNFSDRVQQRAAAYLSMAADPAALELKMAKKDSLPSLTDSDSKSDARSEISTASEDSIQPEPMPLGAHDDDDAYQWRIPSVEVETPLSGNIAYHKSGMLVEIPSDQSSVYSVED